jgi:drug/metabolite transporter (DMT)-like permease
VSRSLKAHVLLVIITLIWGATFVIIKSALVDISVFLFNAIRLTLAAVTLAVVFHCELPHIRRGAVQDGAILGFLLWFGSELQISGLKYTMPSKSAFLTGMAVVLVPVFLAIFWKRKIENWNAVGVASAFVGLYLLTVPASGHGGLNLESIGRGDLLTLGAAVVFAFHIIWMGHATQVYRWQQIAILQTATCALLMIAAVPFGPPSYVVWSGRVIWGILITGFLSLAFSFTIQAWAQQFTPATHTALIFSLEPVFASMTSFLFLGERLGIRGAVGAILILGGVVISEEKGATESMAVIPDHAGVPQARGAQPVEEVVDVKI